MNELQQIPGRLTEEGAQLWNSLQQCGNVVKVNTLVRVHKNGQSGNYEQVHLVSTNGNADHWYMNENLHWERV